MQALNANFTKETYKVYLSALLKGFEEMNDSFRVIAKTAEEMNGKVFNKRFTNRVNEQIGPFARLGTAEFDNWSGKYRCMSVYLNSRSTQIPSVRVGMAGHETAYFDSKVENTLYFDRAKYLKCAAPFVADERNNWRINAEGFKAICAEMIAANEKIAHKDSDALERWDESLEALEELRQKANEIAPRINPLFIEGDNSRVSLWVWKNLTEIATDALNK